MAESISILARDTRSHIQDFEQTPNKEIPIRITDDLSAETLKARRVWQNIFKVMKRKNLQPRLLYQQGSHSDSTEKLKPLQISKS